MTYFQDLTTYAYGRAIELDVLNVGWLSSSQPFPTATPYPAFVSALAKCALRPVRLYRGSHDCEFCPSPEGYGMLEEQHFERSIYLGNGEVRAKAGGITYAAPTLVLHYVSAHRYAPPTEFVEAVLDASSAVYILDPACRGRIRGMTPFQRFMVAIQLLRIAASCEASDGLAEAIQELHEARCVLEPGIESRDVAARPRLSAVSRLPLDDTGVPGLVRSCAQFFIDGRMDAEAYDRRTEMRLVDLLERAVEAAVPSNLVLELIA